MYAPVDLPKDWFKPSWENCNYTHEWKRYVNEELKNEWNNFTDSQKKILAKNMQELADREEYD